MTKPEYEFFDVEQIEPRPVEGQPGLTERLLSYDPDTGDVTRLLYFPPGAETTGVQRHEFCEEVQILKGSIHDLSCNQTFREGMYACRPPGMPHGPWRSAEGCVTFEVRYRKPDTSKAARSS